MSSCSSSSSSDSDVEDWRKNPPPKFVNPNPPGTHVLGTDDAPGGAKVKIEFVAEWASPDQQRHFKLYKDDAVIASGTWEDNIRDPQKMIYESGKIVYLMRHPGKHGIYFAPKGLLELSKIDNGERDYDDGAGSMKMYTTGINADQE